jgi:hypothetical protein
VSCGTYEARVAAVVSLARYGEASAAETRSESLVEAALASRAACRSGDPADWPAPSPAMDAFQPGAFQEGAFQ